jgi:2-C-methyl-D-erythritol 4-phosphate cytidylyltransferase
VARKTGAAILAVPAKDTIKIVSGKGIIQKTVKRNHCWLAQTPQVFKREIAEKIHGLNQKKPKKGTSYTDDASMAEAMGWKVKIVPSSYSNIKITTPEDMILAGSILRERLR